MLAMGLAGAAGPRTAEVTKSPLRSTGLPPPRDGNVAVREELEAARRAATAEAYDLFLARHPDHPLADAARRERRALREAGR